MITITLTDADALKYISTLDRTAPLNITVSDYRADEPFTPEEDAIITHEASNNVDPIETSLVVSRTPEAIQTRLDEINSTKAYKSWHRNDLRELNRGFNTNKSPSEIAKLLHRTENSIRSKAHGQYGYSYSAKKGWYRKTTTNK